MLESTFKIFIKILKNKKFTKFAAVICLVTMVFMVSNSNNNLVQTLVYFSRYSLVKILFLVLVTMIISINFELGLLLVILFSIILNLPLLSRETFENIQNIIDKGKILSYNKNFKEPISILDKNEISNKGNDMKEENKEKEEKEENKEKEELKSKKKEKKKGYAISEDYFNEKKGKNLENKEKDNVEEVNLEGDENDTIEKELKKKFTNDLKKLEEFDSSSSDSSESQSSESSTDSSDSEKELEEVSMTKAREHMLKKLRNGLKKRYIHD